MQNSPHRAALLIDSDNIPLSHIQKVLKICAAHGQLVNCRAYGDWQKAPLAAQKETIKSLNIETIQVDRSGKNATDNRLLMDVGELLERDEVNIFIITSGDGDFTVACRRIREKGKQVIGIGNKKQSSQNLQKSCNKFYFLDELDSELQKQQITTPQKRDELDSELQKQQITAPQKRSEIFAQISFAYHQLTEGKSEWVTLAQLGSKLQILCKDYKNRFAGGKLAKWLGFFKEDFELQDASVRRINDPIRTLLLLIRETHPERICFGFITVAYDGLAPKKDWVSLAQLGTTLHKNPDYKIRFSHRKLSDWLSLFEADFEVKNGQVRRRGGGDASPLNLILTAYAEIARSSGSVSLSALGMALRNNPNLDYKSHFGSKRLSTWIKSYPMRFQIDGHQVRLL